MPKLRIEIQTENQGPLDYIIEKVYEVIKSEKKVQLELLKED